MGIFYRETKKCDFSGLVKLFKVAFEKDVEEYYFDWKYKNGYSLVAELNGEIVGHYGGIFFDFFHKNKTYKIVQVTDLMTHPSVRNLVGERSVLTNLAKLFFEYCLKINVSFAYGFPGERSRLFGEKFFNYKPLSKVKFMHIFLKEGDVLYPVEKFQFINLDIKRIINSNKKSGIIKDISYFCWRYFENPFEDYFISYKEEALFILKLMEREAIVMDFIFKNKKNGRDLFDGIKTSLKNLNIEKIKAFPHKFFEKENFEIKEENYFLEYKPLKLDPGKILKFEHFCPSDFDLF